MFRIYPAVLCLLSASALLTDARGSVALAMSGAAPAPVERVDYLTFAQGAIPLAVSGAGATLGVTMEKAIMAVDGNASGYSLSLKAVPAGADTEFLYALPALTTFDRFAVPNVLETPSPGQTFTRRVEVLGSATARDAGFTLLAAADLSTHRAPGEVTELPVAKKIPVRWVRLRLTGGIDVQREQSFFEFSEIIGNGTQEPVPMADTFSGAWQARGVQIGLRQSGAAVTGCFDDRGVLEGTVTGNILRATGADQRTGVKSLFVLTVTDGNALQGLRSTNGAPFRLYNAAAGPLASLRCEMPGEPVLGCGSVIHGIRFDFDSATIRPESAPVLEQLYAGLRADASAGILIEGHTSGEGTDEYNRALSERRARAVVQDLVQRGVPASRLKAAGLGESRPIATNADESGRSMNRRVEVRCTEGAGS